MTYTVTVTQPNGGSECFHVGTREDADSLYGEYLQLYPDADVRLLNGDAVLASAGPKS